MDRFTAKEVINITGNQITYKAWRYDYSGPQTYTYNPDCVTCNGTGRIDCSIAHIHVLTPLYKQCQDCVNHYNNRAQ